LLGDHRVVPLRFPDNLNIGFANAGALAMYSSTRGFFVPMADY